LREQFIHCKYISLVNLVAGKRIVAELVADEMTAEAAGTRLLPLLPGGIGREKMLRDYDEMLEKLGGPGASERAAELMIKIIEEAKANDTLKMEAPDEVMSSFTRKMKVIDGDMSVKEFEENNNSLIKIAFDGEEIKFPYDDLNLNGLTIIYEDYAN
jgi:hypothetical protein